jgi:hypothetical protein
MRHEGGASNVTEGYGVGHFNGDTSGKCTYLLMNVHEESVGFPPAHFADGICVHSIEMHCHCPTCPEGVTADIILGVS